MLGFPFDSEVTIAENPVTHEIETHFDKAVSSQPLRQLLRKLFTTGIMPDLSDNYLVSAGTDGMTVVVHSGFAVVDGGLALEMEDRTLEVTAAHPTLDRIDTVVLRWNENIDVRDVDMYVVQGTPAASPVRPELQRNNSVYEIGLADIFITRSVATITDEKITDTRYEAERCGVVRSISEYDTTYIYQQVQADLAGFKANEETDFSTWAENQQTLFNEWATQKRQDYEEYMTEQGEDFSDWLNAIKGQLSEDAAGNLQLEVNDLRDSLARVENGDTASTDYAIGDYLMWNGKQYKVIDTISEGDNLEVNVNIEFNNVDSRIKEQYETLHGEIENAKVYDNELTDDSDNAPRTDTVYNALKKKILADIECGVLKNTISSTTGRIDDTIEVVNSMVTPPSTIQAGSILVPEFRNVVRITTTYNDPRYYLDRTSWNFSFNPQRETPSTISRTGKYLVMVLALGSSATDVAVQLLNCNNVNSNPNGFVLTNGLRLIAIGSQNSNNSVSVKFSFLQNIIQTRNVREYYVFSIPFLSYFQRADYNDYNYSAIEFFINNVSYIDQKNVFNSAVIDTVYFKKLYSKNYDSSGYYAALDIQNSNRVISADTVLNMVADSFVITEDAAHTLTLKINKDFSVWELTCVAYTVAANGTATVYGATKRQISCGTNKAPTILSLGQTQNAPATITAVNPVTADDDTHGRITIKNATGRRVLIRIIQIY